MSYPGTASGVGIHVKPWMPAVAGLVLACLLAVGAGVALSGLATGPGSSAPIVMKTVTPGALEKSGIHLSQPVVPIECRPAGWLHLNLVGRCPVSQAAADSAAEAALPRFRPIPLPAVGAAAAAIPITGGAPQVKESVLAWVDVSAQGTANPALHAMVWVVAVDLPATGGAVCPNPKTLVVRSCVAGFPRYLVFVDAMSAKVRLLMARP